MDYKKEYNDTLNVIREIYNQVNDDTKKLFESKFPMLNDSKRIVHILIDMMKRWKNNAEECDVVQDVKDAEKAISLLEKYKVLTQNGEGLYYYAKDGTFTFLGNPIPVEPTFPIEGQCEPEKSSYAENEKQEMTFNDKQYLLVCKNALKEYCAKEKWDYNIISKWLEKCVNLSNIAQESKKVEWTEKDEKIKNALIKYFTTTGGRSLSCDPQEVISWIKNRGPQSEPRKKNCWKEGLKNQGLKNL